MCSLLQAGQCLWEAFAGPTARKSVCARVLTWKPSTPIQHTAFLFTHPILYWHLPLLKVQTLADNIRTLYDISLFHSYRISQWLCAITDNKGSDFKTIDICSLSILETRSPKSKQWQGHAPSEGCRGGSICLFPRVCWLLATPDFPYLNICIILISTNVFIWRSPVCVFLHLCVQISLSLLRHPLLD